MLITGLSRLSMMFITLNTNSVMITNEKIRNCFAPGEIVQFGEVRYIFKESSKTSKEYCDLQTNSSQCYNRYFCMMCGGCGNTFPKWTTKGYFQRMKKTKTFTQLREQAFRLITAADPKWESPRARKILEIYMMVGKRYF